MIARWNPEKNIILKKERDVCFEDVLESEILDDIPHFNPSKYPNQSILVVNIRDYTYYVPYVTEEDGSLFLKNIIPSRSFHKKYTH